MLQHIVEKTDGVPLYVEEMTKAVLESGILKETDGQYELTAPVTSLSIPATLQDSLMARLDRLITAKAVAQYASVIGRQFSYALLQAVSQLDQETLQRELGRLVDVELLYQRGLSTQATYTFKHALLQDAAYQSLLKGTRQQYHHRIANVLETQFFETAQHRPELLAYHCTAAGLTQQAVAYWKQAGEQAIQRSANVEAISHLTKGLAVLGKLPDTPERVQSELKIQMTLGRALMATKGYAAADVEATYHRAQMLCDQLADTSQRFGVLAGLCQYYLIRGPLQTARDLATHLLQLAQSQSDPAGLQAAHYAMGQTLIWLGNLPAAREHLEQVLALTDPQWFRPSPWPASHPEVSCSLFDATALWLLGLPDQARSRMQQALSRARELAHPLSLALTLTFTARLSIWCGETHIVETLVTEFVTLSEAQRFTQMRANARVFEGWLLVMQGEEDEGLAQLRQGVEAYHSTGAQMMQPWSLSLLAEVSGTVGQVETACMVLDEAFGVVSQTGERFWEAELYRVQSTLLRRSAVPDVDQATACFLQALAVARRQEAKSLELRAATSLARLWQSQGKRQDAYDLLAPVYGWFTEGFDTADLQDAKALLEALS